MIVAVVARCPMFGGSLGSFDAGVAKAVPGVVEVLEVPSGIAVVAKHFWAAKKGRDALSVAWKPSPNGELSTADVVRELRAAAGRGKEVQKHGDPERILNESTRKLEAVYEVPYLAAAPMEPLGCTAHVGHWGSSWSSHDGRLGDVSRLPGGRQVPPWRQPGVGE